MGAIFKQHLHLIFNGKNTQETQVSVRIVKLSSWEIQILFPFENSIQAHQVHAVRHTRGTGFCNTSPKALCGNLWQQN